MTNSHKADGDWIMGLGLVVSKDGCKNAIPKCLILYIREYLIRNRKKGAIIVSKLSGYHHYKDKYSPEEYARLKRNGRPVDPTLRYFSQYGFFVPENPTVIDNYVDGGGDPNSCGYSVVIAKKNPFACLPPPVGYLVSKVFALGIRVEKWRKKCPWKGLLDHTLGIGSSALGGFDRSGLFDS